VAIGAIAIIVHLPNGCDYNQNTPTLIRDRPVMTNANLERLWDGDPSFQTWGKVFPWLSGKADCDKQIHRVVRQESSGTSFALKQFLNEINPAAGWNAASQANTVWPNSDTDAVTLANAASGSGERNTVRDTDSSIGYVDLATARGDNGTFYWQNASDETFWLPIARKASTTQFDEPTSDANGYKDPTTNAAPNANTVAPGANCFNATPKTALPADASSDWSNVDYTYSDNAYGPCTLTYDLVFDDDSSVYCNSPAEESQARTLKDYFTRGVVSAAGQNSLVNAYYDRLPTDALAKAQAAVDSLGWKKNGSSGRPCPGSASPTPTPTATPSTTPAPPAPPSNKFAITSARSVTSGTSAAVRLSLQLPGAGKLSIKGTAKPKKGKSVTLSTKSASATKAGTQTITISLSSKAKSALKKNKTLSVKLTITFTPNGGTAATQSKTVTVKQPKAKKKKSKK
jgi:hypothetical protein